MSHLTLMVATNSAANDEVASSRESLKRRIPLPSFNDWQSCETMTKVQDSTIFLSMVLHAWLSTTEVISLRLSWPTLSQLTSVNVIVVGIVTVNRPPIGIGDAVGGKVGVGVSGGDAVGGKVGAGVSGGVVA